jgi:hypothetical protein
MQRTPDIIIDHEGLTLAQTMYRLMQVVDYTKLSFNSKIVIGASVFRIMSKAESYNQSLIFAQTQIFGNTLRTIQYTVGTNINGCKIIDNNVYRDASSDQATMDICLYY